MLVLRVNRHLDQGGLFTGGGHRARAVIHGEVARADQGVVGLHFTVNLNRVGEQNRVAVGGVHAIFADGEGAARYGIAADGAIVGHINLAGGQDSLVGINKATAGTGDAVRVGDYHIRFLTVDFDKALQATGVFGGHLVQNHRSAAGGQIIVAGDIAKCAVADIIAAVIKDGAIGADVEVAVQVMGDTGGIRLFNIDNRGAGRVRIACGSA